MSLKTKQPQGKQRKIGPKEQANIDARNAASNSQVKSATKSSAKPVAAKSTSAKPAKVKADLAPATPDAQPTESKSIKVAGKDGAVKEIAPGIAATAPVAPVESNGQVKVATKSTIATDKAAAKARHDELAAANNAARKADREAKKAQRPAPEPKIDLGERYNAAAAEVGRLRQEFLAALDEKAALLGTTRNGEALAPRQFDAATAKQVAALDADIKALTEKLTAKRAERGAIVGEDTPQVKAVSERVNDLRRQREVARAEKKAAYTEAAERLGLPKSDATDVQAESASA